MKIKAVIFDMDGVLIDAKEWHYEALNRALSLFGYEITRYEHLVTYDGLPTSKKLEMLSLEKGMSVQLHRFINKLKQDYTIDRIFMDCHPVFAHEYALSKLRAQGYSLAVASNSIRDTVEMMMKKSNLLPYLNFFLSNQDVSNAKPHPEIYQVAVEKLELNPSECLVLEDNRNGIEAAKAAGTHVMQVSTIFDVNYENINRNIELAENGRI